MTKRWVSAQRGDELRIGQIGMHLMGGRQVGVFHAIGTEPTECIVCVESGTPLMLADIPEALQERFAIGATARATFEESKDFIKDDTLRFGGNQRLNLRAFAGHGIRVIVGEAPNTSAAVEGIKKEAIRSASSATSAAPARDLEHA